MKRFLILLALTVAFLAVPVRVAAVDTLGGVCDNPDAVEKPAVCNGTDNGDSNDASSNPLFGPNGILTRIVTLLSFIAGVAAVIMIIYAGFRYVTSNGDTNTTATAQKAIIYGVVGLVVVAMSQILVIFVLSKL